MQGPLKKQAIEAVADAPKGGRSQGQRNAELTRENILAAASEEFADKGLAGARVDEIGQRTSTSKHMIYYYFGSKEGLYRAVLERAYANFRLAEEAVDYTSLDPVDAMGTLVGRTFDVHVNNPYFVRIIMGENINSGEHIGEVKNSSSRREILETMREILRRGVEAGTFRDGIDALQLHMTVSALCFYFVSNRYTFGHIFQINLADPDVIAARRQNIVDTILTSCLRHDR